MEISIALTLILAKVSVSIGESTGCPELFRGVSCVEGYADCQCDEFESTDDAFILPNTPGIQGLRRVSTGDVGNRIDQKR